MSPSPGESAGWLVILVAVSAFYIFILVRGILHVQNKGRRAVGDGLGLLVLFLFMVAYYNQILTFGHVLLDLLDLLIVVGCLVASVLMFVGAGPLARRHEALRTSGTVRRSPVPSVHAQILDRRNDGTSAAESSGEPLGSAPKAAGPSGESSVRVEANTEDAREAPSASHQRSLREDSPPVAAAPPRTRRSARTPAWLLALAALVVAANVYFWGFHWRSSPPSWEVQGPALTSKTEAARPERPEDLESRLISLAEGDPERQGLRVNVKAVEELSRMRSVKGLPAILKTLFLKTQRGEEMYQAARLALVRVGGEPTKQILVETLNGNNDDLRKWARSNGIPDWEWQDGPKVVQVIGDLSDPDAAVAVAQNMAKELIWPTGFTDQALEQWKTANSNRITINMLTLARIGDDRVVPILAAVIADPMADFKQRMDSASALAAIGTPSAVDALLEIYRKSTDQRFRAPFLRPLSAALDADHTQKFQDVMARDVREEAQLVLDRFSSDPIMIASLALLYECGDDTACYLNALNMEPSPAYDPPAPPDGSEPPYTRFDIAWAIQWKAIVLLSRARDDASAVIPALLDKFAASPATATDIRNYSLIALERLSRDDPRVFEGLERILEAERGKEGFEFWNTELEVRVASYKARHGIRQ